MSTRGLGSYPMALMYAFSESTLRKGNQAPAIVSAVHVPHVGTLIYPHAARPRTSYMPRRFNARLTLQHPPTTRHRADFTLSSRLRCRHTSVPPNQHLAKNTERTGKAPGDISGNLEKHGTAQGPARAGRGDRSNNSEITADAGRERLLRRHRRACEVGKKSICSTGVLKLAAFVKDQR